MAMLPQPTPTLSNAQLQERLAYINQRFKHGRATFEERAALWRQSIDRIQQKVREIAQQILNEVTPMSTEELDQARERLGKLHTEMREVCECLHTQNEKAQKELNKRIEDRCMLVEKLKDLNEKIPGADTQLAQQQAKINHIGTAAALTASGARR